MKFQSTCAEVDIDYVILDHMYPKNFEFFCEFKSGKESACNAGDTGSIPGQEDPLRWEIATHSSTLVWKIPWTEKPEHMFGFREILIIVLNSAHIQSLNSTVAYIVL